MSRSRLVTDGSHQFVIQGYSLAKGMGAGNYLSSDNFTVGGDEWAILFYPHGAFLEDESYISVVIVLRSESESIKSGLLAFREITLVDQSGNENHHIQRVSEQSRDNAHLLPRTYVHSRYFRRSMLETSDYLKDDCLILMCKIRVVASEIRSLPDSVHVPDSDLGSQFGVLLDSMEESDVTFDIAGEKFLAHKPVLAARSPLLMARVLNEFEVTINDLEPTVFKAMLHFMYKDTLPEDIELSKICDTSLIVKLLKAAEKYDMERLSLLCQSHICKGVSVSSVAKIFTFAERYNAKELKNVCLKFTAHNLEDVLKTDALKTYAYQQMKDESLSELLKALVGHEEDSNNAGGAKSQSVWAGF